MDEERSPQTKRNPVIISLTIREFSREEIKTPGEQNPRLINPEKEYNIGK